MLIFLASFPIRSCQKRALQFLQHFSCHRIISGLIFSQSFENVISFKCIGNTCLRVWSLHARACVHSQLTDTPDLPEPKNFHLLQFRSCFLQDFWKKKRKREAFKYSNEAQTIYGSGVENHFQKPVSVWYGDISTYYTSI